MSKYDRNYSRHSKHSYPKYKVIFDSNQDEHKKSRSRSRIRSSSPQLLQSILDGHISENLELLNKNYKTTLESFKVVGETIKDPYDFTILPVLNPTNDISELIESAKKLRRETKEINFALTDARLNLMLANIKVHECDTKLASIKAQLAPYSTLH